MSVTTLKVKKKLNKTTKTGKPWWSILGADDKWYSVWDEHVADQLQEGTEYSVGTETKGDFTTIKSIVPPAFLDGLQDVMPGVVEVPDPPLPEPQVHIPPTKKLAEQVTILVDERMRAMDSAVALAAATQIPADIRAMAEVADKIIKYYHGEAL